MGSICHVSVFYETFSLSGWRGATVKRLKKAHHINEESMHGGAGGTWEISAPSVQFSCEPKTTLTKLF
jgi:hypothetical protein